MIPGGGQDGGVGAADDDRLIVIGDVRIPRHELSVSFSPSGGPGGQHANKAATRVELVFDPTISAAFDDAQRERVISQLGAPIRVVVDDERSQLRNRQLAEQRLVERLQSALRRPRRRRPTKPTKGSQRRRLRAKSRRSELKQQRRSPGPED